MHAKGETLLGKQKRLTQEAASEKHRIKVEKKKKADAKRYQKKKAQLSEAAAKVKAEHDATAESEKKRMKVEKKKKADDERYQKKKAELSEAATLLKKKIKAEYDAKLYKSKRLEIIERSKLDYRKRKAESVLKFDKKTKGYFLPKRVKSNANDDSFHILTDESTHRQIELALWQTPESQWLFDLITGSTTEQIRSVLLQRQTIFPPKTKWIFDLLAKQEPTSNHETNTTEESRFIDVLQSDEIDESSTPEEIGLFLFHRLHEEFIEKVVEDLRRKFDSCLTYGL